MPYQKPSFAISTHAWELKIQKNRIEPENDTGSKKRISVVTGIHGDELEGQYVCFEQKFVSLLQKFPIEKSAHQCDFSIFPLLIYRNPDCLRLTPAGAKGEPERDRGYLSRYEPAGN